MPVIKLMALNESSLTTLQEATPVNEPQEPRSWTNTPEKGVSVANNNAPGHVRVSSVDKDTLADLVGTSKASRQSTPPTDSGAEVTRRDTVAGSRPVGRSRSRFSKSSARQSKVLEQDVLAERRRSLRRSRFLEKSEIPDLPALRTSQRELGYRPLDIAKFEFWIVEFLSGDADDEQPDDELRCRLIYASLINSPPYTALSYNWGDTATERTIILNDMRVPVSANLDAALRQLRRRGERRVWVAFLSMNQADNSERSYQLLRSSQIYSKATKTIAWLGSPDDDSDEAMSFLQQFDISRRPPQRSASKRADRSSVMGLVTRELRNSVLFRNLALTDSQEHNSVFDALEKLLSRPYFERAWILQETATSNRVELLCDAESGTLEALEDYARLAAMPEFKHPLPLPVKGLLHFREQEQASHGGTARMTLLAALVASRLSLTTDERDKIYAFLALTRDAADVVPTPNYVEQPRDVLLSASAKKISVQGQTALTLLACRSTPTRSTLPTWAPDWVNLRHASVPDWICTCNEQQRVNRIALPIINESTLTLRAVELEQILSMSGQAQSLTLPEEDAPFDEASMRDASITLWDTLTEVCKQRAESDSADYKVAALKLLLEEKDSRRAAEISELAYGPHSIRDWLSKYPAGLITNLTRRAIRSRNECSALKAAIKVISEHDLKVAVCGKDRESDTFRLVYRKAHVGERIWRIQNCALPVVLKAVLDASGTGRTFQVVGEVFLRNLEGEAHWTDGTG